jgi:HEAT repeat protein
MSVKLGYNENLMQRVYVIVSAVLILLAACAATGYAGTQDESSVSDLMSVVKGPDNKVSPWERWAAVMEIGRHGTLEAAEALVSLLHGSLAFPASIALTHIEDKRALPLLVSNLSHDSQWVRISICETLGALGGDEAVTALFNVAKNDGQKWVRQAAVHALGVELSASPKGPVTSALLEILKIPELADDAERALRKLRDKAAVEKLYPALSYESAQARIMVCDIIRFHHHADSTDQLLSLLKREKDNQVIGKAIVSLASVHPPDRLSEVSAVLTDFLKDEQTASSALQAIESTLRKNESVDPQTAAILGKALLPSLASDSKSIRHGATRVFEKLSYPGASPKLIGLIQKEEDRYARNSAIVALGNCLREEKHLRLLFDWAENHSEDSEAVGDALDRVDHPVSVKPFIDELNKKQSRLIKKSIEALGRIKDPVAAKPLLQLIENGDSMAMSAAQVLPVVAGKKHLPRMAEILMSESGLGNYELINSFVALDRLNEFGQLKALLKAAGDKKNRALEAIFYRWNAVPSDAQILTEALSTEDKSVKRAVISPLSQIDSMESREALCQVLQNEPDRSVRVEAGKALGNFADTRTIKCLLAAYKAALMDTNAILVKEAIQSSLAKTTGQRFDGAEHYQNWLDREFGTEDGIGLRIKALNHQDTKLRLLAAREIAQWPDPQEQRQALVPIMELMKKDGQFAEQMQWVRTLGSIGDPCAIPILEKQLEDETNLEAIATIAKALTDLKNKMGVARLMNSLSPGEYDRKYDQKEVIEALSMVTGQPLNYDADYWKKWWAKQNKG